MPVVENALKNGGKFNFIDNYIYLYHVKEFLVLPMYAESITDKIDTTFASTSILSRSAPIQSFSHSGPRSINFQFPLHRDVMSDLNAGVANVTLLRGEDYMDYLIRHIQAAALPVYSSSDKLVNPPMVAVRMGTDIFIKGIVNGGVTIGYEPPILDDGKYAKINISFNVTEVEPYDARQVMEYGSYRGISTTLERNAKRLVADRIL